MVRRISLPRLAAHGLLAAVAAFCLLPVVWMALTALRPPVEVLDRSLLPSSLGLGSLSRAFSTLPIGELVLNTAIMSAVVCLGQLATSLLAAYAFGCWRFRGDRVLLVLFVASWMIPFQVTMIPNYVLLAELGWLNRLVGVVVPQLVGAFGVLLLRQHLRSFPRELLEAARMDGMGSWQTLWRVVVPNLRAPLSALAILLFVSAWNEYLWPMLVLQQDGGTVVQVGLKAFDTEVGTDYGPLMAAVGATTVPIFVLYLVLQRHVVDAFVRSGLR